MTKKAKTTKTYNKRQRDPVDVTRMQDYVFRQDAINMLGFTDGSIWQLEDKMKLKGYQLMGTTSVMFLKKDLEEYSSQSQRPIRSTISSEISGLRLKNKQQEKILLFMLAWLIVNSCLSLAVWFKCI